MFISFAGPLRLAMANFATMMVKLIAVIGHAKSNTYVVTLNAWRDRDLKHILYKI
jgi:hypothetical protein